MKKKTIKKCKYLYLFLLLAVEIIFPAVQENQKDLSAMLKDAERELDWQFFEEAKSSYMSILQQYPQHNGLNEALGYICLMQQKYEESFGYFEKELALDTDNDLSRLLLGIAHFQNGDLSSARELVEKVDSNQSYIGNKTFNRSKNNFLKRYPFFKKFKNDNPGLLPFVMGIIYKEQGEWEYAEEMMDEAANQKYCLAEVMVQLIDQYLQQQDSASAASVLSKLERQNFQLAEQMNKMVELQDRPKAHVYARSRPIIIRYLKESISTIVDNLNIMAQSALKRAEPESAIKTWKKALYIDDNRFIIHYNIALIYCLYNFPQEALYHCRRAIDLGDSQYQPWALNLAGNIQFAMSNFKQALYYYQQAINLDPGYLKCRNNLGATYLKLGDLTNAEREWRKVIRNSGRGGKENDIMESADRENIKIFVDVKESDETIEAGKSLAALYLQQKQMAQAIPLLEMVLRFIPTDADTHFELAKIYMQLDNLELARRHFMAAIKNGTTFTTEAMNLSAELEKKMK